MLNRIPIILALVLGLIHFVVVVVLSICFHGERLAWLLLFVEVPFFLLANLMASLGLGNYGYDVLEHPLLFGSFMYGVVGYLVGWLIRYMEQKHET